MRSLAISDGALERFLTATTSCANYIGELELEAQGRRELVAVYRAVGNTQDADAQAALSCAISGVARERLRSPHSWSKPHRGQFWIWCALKWRSKPEMCSRHERPCPPPIIHTSGTKPATPNTSELSCRILLAAGDTSAAQASFKKWLVVYGDLRVAT